MVVDIEPLKQKRDRLGCSETVAAMIIRYYGVETGPMEIYRKEGEDLQFQDIPRVVYEYTGRVTNIRHGSRKDVKEEVDRGRPVAVRTHSLRVGHTLLVVGWRDGVFVVNDPSCGERKETGLRNFWGLYVTVPNRHKSGEAYEWLGVGDS